MGIPYAEHGRDFSGCDCWGLSRLVLRLERGIDMPGYDGAYANTDDGLGMVEALADFLPHWTEIGKPEPFAVILRAFHNGCLHCGVVVVPGTVLHCAKGKGAVVERMGLLWKGPAYYVPSCTG